MSNDPTWMNTFAFVYSCMCVCSGSGSEVFGALILNVYSEIENTNKLKGFLAHLISKMMPMPPKPKTTG